MLVEILALNDVFDTGLSTVLDAFQTANELAVLHGIDTPPFATRIVGVRPEVRSAQGLSVPAREPAAETPAWVLVPAIGFKLPGPLAAALGRPELGDAAAYLRGRAAGGASVAAACVGTFVLAESGLLDGRRATTTWWLAPFFRSRYPGVGLDDARMIVPDGPVVTAGAALGHLDLALWLIRRQSPELASLAARYLIADERPSQSAYALVDQLAHDDPVVRRFEAWARANLSAGFSLEEAARSSGASKRTLARRVASVLGRTPLSYVQDLRIERAAHLLRATAMGVEEVAAAVGYADGVTLRTLLRRRLGKGVRDLRARP